MVETLLEAGADPGVARPNGETALMHASRAGAVDVVRALLARGADVNAKTSRGFTALIFAAAEGRGCSRRDRGGPQRSHRVDRAKGEVVQPSTQVGA